MQTFTEQFYVNEKAFALVSQIYTLDYQTKQAICESQNGELGNRIREMWRIRVKM